MSKTLGNGVDLGEQIDAYGVDAVRLTMIFASPPEDDIDWADVSPDGARKFLARAWRLAGEVTAPVGSDPAGGDAALRKQTHHTVHEAGQLIEGHKFNVVVARLMELVNATRKVVDSGAGAGDPAVREAVEVDGDPAESGRAVHRGGHVGPARSPAVRRPGRLAGRRREPAGRGRR